jgi:pimeloyl-ACP methyl ester carboxylesterase
MERIELLTADGVKVIGDFFRASSLSGGVVGTALLLHMMPADRRSWLGLARRLSVEGVQTLAIDLRGHGDSVFANDGRRLDYRQFSHAEHQESLRDVRAAVGWLSAERRVRPDAMIVGGASIGANLALAYAAEEPNLRGVFALSPGLDYRGVTTADKVVKLGPRSALFLAASEDDTHGSWEAVHRLADLRRGSELVELANAGHGTEMLEREPELEDRLAGWIKDILKPNQDA